MRVLVTGASGELLGETARLLRAAGHDVVGLDLRADRDVVACDLRDHASIPPAVATAVERLGGLDVLINGAGILAVQDTGLPPDDDSLAVLDINLLGAWRVTAAALPALLASTGRPRVVLVSSIASQLGMPLGAAYVISKRGLVAYASVLRAEYGTRLDVVTVHPAYVRTGLYTASGAAGVGLDGILPADPAARTARAIARAAVSRSRRPEVATSLNSAVIVSVGRHLPRLLAAVTDALVARAIVSGRFDTSVVAQGLVRRVKEGRR